MTLPGTWAAGDWNTGSYSYDGAGNITAQLADGITTESETYTYDAVSRLTRWTRAGVASESYGFDPFGNLINYNGRTLSVLGTTNRLSAAGYDASGNMTAWNGFSFSWDALDRMTALVGNGLARRFAFTADGERVLEREGSTYTFSLRGLDNRVLREMKATWTGAGWAWDWEKDSIWGAGRLVASVSASDGIRHAHVDHLGSPRLLTNRCGQRVALLDHNPWGLDRPTGVQDGERHRFTAHQRDLGSLERTWDDFDYMHARTYTPYLGRFVSVDPGRDNDPKVPQSWNLYAYVRGNPVRLTDPDGRLSEDEVKRVAQGAAATTGATAIQDAAVRQQYVTQVNQLSPTDTVARTAAKEAARDASSPVAKNLAEAMRPIAGEAARAGGTASKTNLAVNEGMAAVGKGGVVLVVVGAGISATNIATAPSGQRLRVASEEAGAWVGALSFGAAGAKGGAALGFLIGGPVGGVVGGTVAMIGGGVVGAFAGAKAGGNIYDASVGP